MFRGFYTAASGMFSQQRRQDMLTNNIANANTPGYKADQAALRAFPEMLLQRMDDQSIGDRKIRTSTQVGSLNTGAYMQEVIPTFQQGDMEETGKMTDIALIDGQLPDEGGLLFFTVQDQNGEFRYTRNGDFSLDAQGNVVSSEGFFVLGENGEPIQINSDTFQINDQGTVVVEGQQVAQLGLAYANNPQDLIKVGNSLFQAENDLPNARENNEVTFKIQQGFLERSNVDMNKTMTEMLNAYRLFEANQKILQAYDRSMDKAVNEVGRLR